MAGKKPYNPDDESFQGQLYPGDGRAPDIVDTESEEVLPDDQYVDFATQTDLNPRTLKPEAAAVEASTPTEGFVEVAPRPSATAPGKMELESSSTSTTTGSKQYAPGTLQAVAAGMDEVANKTRNLGQAEAELQNRRIDADAASAAYQQNQMALQDDWRRQENERLQVKKSEVDQLSDKFDKMAVDPNNYFKSLDGTGKAMTIAGLLLGGLGAAYQASANPQGNYSNQALKVFDNMIERDIDAQKANIAKAGQAVGQKQSLYRDAVAALGDEDAARKWVMGKNYESFAKLVQSQAEKSTNPIVKQKAELAVAEINAKKDQLMADAQAQTVSKVQTDVKKDALSSMAKGDKPQALSNELLLKEIAPKETNIKRMAALKSYVQKHPNSVGLFETAKRKLLDKFGQDANPETIATAIKGDQQFINGFKQFGLGAPSAKEFEFVRDMFANPSSSTNNFLTVLDTNLNSATDDYVGTVGTLRRQKVPFEPDMEILRAAEIAKRKK